MKKLMFSLFAATLFMATTTILTSCNSDAQKADAAQNKVADAKDKMADAKDKMADAKDNLTEAQKTANAAAKKAADTEAWKGFKAESEAAIKVDEARIAELKVQIKKAGKSADAKAKENLMVLEKKVAAMKNRISDYDKSQSDWESFKTEFNHDMKELGQALKDFTVNNKK